MIVKIRFPEGRRRNPKVGSNRELAAAFGALLVPASLMAYSLGFWRLASDIGLAGHEPGLYGETFAAVFVVSNYVG